MLIYEEQTNLTEDYTFESNHLEASLNIIWCDIYWHTTEMTKTWLEAETVHWDALQTIVRIFVLVIVQLS